MKKSICFYANKTYLPHLDVSLKSLRLVDKNCNVNLIAVTEKNEIKYFKKYEKYNLRLINFPKEKLINQKINSVKLMMFDIIDSDVVVHYDADFVFRKPIPEWTESKKIKMVLGNSKGKQIYKKKYYKIYKKLHEVYSKKEKTPIFPFSESSCVNYNAGFFVASRKHHRDIFEKCKFLMSQNSEYHSSIPNVIDQYIINYLFQTFNMIEEVSPLYNWHCGMKLKSKVFAVHFANSHQDHLYSENSDFWPKEISDEDLFRKLYV